MKIKECYVSHNGISCFTNINSLINVKDIKMKYIKNSGNFNINTFLFYLGLRCCEFIIKDFIKNRVYLFDKNLENSIFDSITFS